MELNAPLLLLSCGFDLTKNNLALLLKFKTGSLDISQRNQTEKKKKKLSNHADSELKFMRVYSIFYLIMSF